LAVAAAPCSSSLQVIFLDKYPAGLCVVAGGGCIGAAEMGAEQVGCAARFATEEAELLGRERKRVEWGCEQLH